ncbi:DUF928 domain-containing protein [Oscillatoria sp. FACHB-1407]|uniref:DUF928 domain-containing protein n=1 Tax=Oscillatoria sp. FACHB-1407 TaxID=2692847 RepID=UPI00168234DE|nr:DUF928 domain-containing protein [Oscillatoria sp. FACHB-1407]MBD2459789.1 DUF928 domain-containing protein [Oscillatoria sp. FACHB-1407]
MLAIQPPFHVMRSVCSFGLILTSLLTAVVQSSARATSDPLNQEQVVFVAPQPPLDQGAPSGRRQGGASRGPCRNYETLTALTPVTSDGKVWGLTTLDRPTFWFHIPNTLTDDVPVEFVLQDSEDNYVYRTRASALETQSGIISVSLDASERTLEVGKTYHWTFSIYCDAAHPSASVFVRGSVQRIAPSSELEQQLSTATPLQQASVYAANGIWYEALTLLATLKQHNPGDSRTSTAWTELLEQADLGAIAPAPIVSCCTFDQIPSSN